MTDKIRVVADSGDDYPSVCLHQFISWHGSRGECQDCGENVTIMNSQDLLDLWAAREFYGIYSKDFGDD